MSNSPKVGLVLSGGGAKGAYQVGLLQALNEMGVQVDMVSGASIGALNGGVLAAAPNLTEGVIRLEKLWGTLAKASPLEVCAPAFIQLLAAAGSTLLPSGKLLMLALLARGNPVFSDEPLTKLVNEYLDSDELAHGLPMYVSVYKSLGAVTDISRFILAATGLRETPNSEFLLLQSLSKDEQQNALLASAALPALFKAREINGQKYSDGSQGGRSKAQGSTPIQPLIDAGCNFIIVNHLTDGSLWSRHDFPNVTVLEVRPQSTMARDSGFFGASKDLLGFDANKIPSWIEQGYRDTMHCMGRIKDAVDARGELNKSKLALEKGEQRGAEADANLSDIMSSLLSDQ